MDRHKHTEIRPYAVGIDVGGTKIASGIVHQDGRVLHRFTTHAHSEKEPLDVIEAIVHAYRQVMAGSGLAPDEIEGIGVGFPGNTNASEGLVLTCSNLPAWSRVPLRNILAARLHMPVVLENDTNLCAVGEHRYGAGRGVHNLCYVTISTGLGVGIIVDNRLYVGCTGQAGELGHAVVDPGGPLCSCGKRGCLMAYTSGIGLSRMVYEKIEAGAETVLRELLPRGGRRIPGEVIAQAAKEGDAVAREVVETAGWYGGLGLSIIVQFLNPERIIVGGGLTHIGAMLEQPMMKALYEYTQPELWDSIDVRPWQLGDDIGILGAAAKVFADSEHHHDRLYAVVSRFIVERTEPAKNVHVYTPSTGLSSRERAELEKVEGVVFDVQRYSLHDGPGLRTNVFLKGCPLRCGWCSNPESQQLDPELALFSDRCIVCGQFPEACTVGWKLRRNGEWSDDLEREFTARAAVCPAGAMNRIGWRSTAGEILRDVLRDAPFYEDGGGLTLTGGEPTIQPHLAEALLRLTKDACISTAIETCGHTKWPVLEHLLPYLDDILYDLKHMDNEVHRAFTGVGNELILENLRKLVSCGVPVTVRVPLIPGFNDTIESLEAIAEFIVSLDRPVRRVDVLPYQTLGRSKYKALGREYPWKKHDRLTEEQVESLSKRMAYYGLDVNIGG